MMVPHEPLTVTNKVRIKYEPGEPSDRSTGAMSSSKRLGGRGKATSYLSLATGHNIQCESVRDSFLTFPL